MATLCEAGQSVHASQAYGGGFLAELGDGRGEAFGVQAGGLRGPRTVRHLAPLGWPLHGFAAARRLSSEPAMICIEKTEGASYRRPGMINPSARFVRRDDNAFPHR